MTCQTCGAPMQDTATFCRQCGAIAEVSWLPPEPPPHRRPGDHIEFVSALRIAAMTAVIGLTASVTLYGVRVVLDRIALGGPPGSESIRIPFDLWLSGHGALEGVGVTLTVVAWLWLAARLAVFAHIRLLRPIGDDSERGTSLVAGLLYFGFTSVMALVAYAGSDTTATIFELELAGAGSTVLNNLVVVPVIGLAVLQGLRKTRRATLTELLPDPPSNRVIARWAWTGFSHSLAAAAIYATIERFAYAVPSARNVPSWLPDTARELSVVGTRLVTTGVDLAFGYLVAAMGAFTIDLFPFAAPFGSVPVRAWFGIPVLIAIIFSAGMTAGRVAQRIGLPPLPIGIGVGGGIVTLAFVASWLASPNADGLTKYSIIFPAIWIAVPVLGAVVGGRPRNGGG
jgi:hypothetical protein